LRAIFHPSTFIHYPSFFMLYRQHFLKALQTRREEFVAFERAWRDEVSAGARVLRGLGNRRAAEIDAMTRGSTPGALPSEELDRHNSMAVAFRERWRSHEGARGWAKDVLFERTTFAADGSQILPGREISLPVAGVQVAWFENPHTLDGRGYRKDARFEVVTPKELLEADGGAANAGAVVNLRRFHMEAQAVGEFLESKRGWRERGERVPIAFFDGMLLLITAVASGRINAKPESDTLFPTAYVNDMARLVRLSRDTQVPVVGYIDQSYARDLVRLVSVLDKSHSKRASGVYDAQLLRTATTEDAEPPLLCAWGDRTVFCYCLREGLPEDFIDERGVPLVGFVYLQTTAESTPARLDVPTWVYEAGLLDEVMDAVRAECVVGNGYPYALETADAAAVITSQDRERFLHAMQEFAEEGGFALRVSRKAVSKIHRR
jgi:hypothetical protein